MITQPPPSNRNYSIIGIVGVVVAMASLLIAYKGYNRKNAKPEPKPKENVIQEEKPSVSNLESL